MIPIPTLFGQLLFGCTDKETTPEPVSFTLNECDTSDDYSYESTFSFEIEEEEFLALLDENGQVSEEACLQICTDANIDPTCTCAYVGPKDDKQEFTCSEINYYAPPYEGRGNGCISKTSTGTGPSALAQWSANAYHAEASSVAAFLQIRQELASFGAPQELLDRCLKAACDEVAHARVMGKICLENNGTLSTLSFDTTPERSLLDFAIDNIQEGCVGEAYAAFCALYQSQSLSPSPFQKILQNIARDELQHVELAYDIHQWCCTQLSQVERLFLLQKQKEAFANILEHRPTDETFLPIPPKEMLERMAERLSARAA